MKKLSVFYIILAGILWGMSGIFFNTLSSYGFSPVQITSMRSIVAAVFMVVFLFVKGKELFKARLREVMLFAASGIMIFFTSFFYYTAIKEASISVGVVLMYTAPAIVMAVSVIFFGEKLTLLKTAATAGTLVGCGLVTGIIGGAYFNFVGVLAGLMSGISYSTYNILVKIEMKRGNDPITANAYCFIASGALSLFFVEPRHLFEVCSVPGNSPAVPLLAVGVGVITCALPYFFYTLGMKKLPAGTASALGTVEPLTGCLVGIFIYNEAVTVQSVCGIVIMLVSVVALSRTER